jgi:hypothetical protein
VREIRVPEQRDQVLAPVDSSRGDAQHDVEQPLELGWLHAGPERERVQAVAEERHGEVVVARCGGRHRLLVAEHLVGGELEPERAVSIEQRAQVPGELLPKARRVRVARLVEPTRLQRARELPEPRCDVGEVRLQSLGGARAGAGG